MPARVSVPDNGHSAKADNACRAFVVMPAGWTCHYTGFDDLENWFNSRDGSDVMISTADREAIWISVGEETRSRWPCLDSPMPVPHPDSPIEIVAEQDWRDILADFSKLFSLAA